MARWSCHTDSVSESPVPPAQGARAGAELRQPRDDVGFLRASQELPALERHQVQERFGDLRRPLGETTS